MSDANQLDLAGLFQAVASAIADNRQNLNQADIFNHDHGDNMVQVFELISKAMQQRKNADPASQLAHASQLLSQQKSGSAQVYAQGLSQAANEFKGQTQISPEETLKLIQSLMGGGQAPTNAPSSATGDLLNTMLGGLGKSAGGSQTQAGSSEINATDLLNAGMAFLNAKQGGSSNLDALVKALVSDSAMSQSEHRAQSGALVAGSILQAISMLMAKK